MKRNVPTEADWGNWGADLDTEYAHENFAGKTREEVFPLFQSNVIERTDELRFMPPVPFRYYMLAFRDYVLSERVFAVECEASDAASCFLGLILEKLESDPSVILPVMEELLPAAEEVAGRQEEYDAPVDIYGSFPRKVVRMRLLWDRSEALEDFEESLRKPASSEE